MDDIQEGRTATSKDGKRRVVYRDGQWVNDTSFVPQTVKVKTSATDQKALEEALALSTVERDAQRSYDRAEKSVEAMGTGPFRARWLDTILPDEEGGFWDTAGAIIGSPFSAFLDEKTIAARDHLKSVGAEAAVASSAGLKGPTSDRDIAILRLTGVSPYKSLTENRRVIRQARDDSHMKQLRATLRSKWISRYGSTSVARADGVTFASALVKAENEFQRWQDSQRQPRAANGLPKPPPKRGASAMTIDLNGNPIR